MSAAAPPEQVLVDRRHTTVVGYNAVVGVNAVMLPGVTLGDGAILAAGSVATHDIPAHEIWAGVPARYLRRRIYEAV